MSLISPDRLGGSIRSTYQRAEGRGREVALVRQAALPCHEVIAKHAGTTHRLWTWLCEAGADTSLGWKARPEIGALGCKQGSCSLRAIVSVVEFSTNSFIPSVWGLDHYYRVVGSFSVSKMVRHNNGTLGSFLLIDFLFHYCTSSF
jgi:hypothetical protein